MSRGAYLPVREYADASEMLRHAAEVRARMFAPRPAPVAVEIPVVIAEAEPVVEAEPAPPTDDLVTATREAYGPIVLAGSYQQREGRADMRAGDCLKLVVAVSGMPVEAVRGNRRVLLLVKARQILFWLLSERAGKSLLDTGRFVGGRDHTTALHGIRRVKSIIQFLNLDASGPADDLVAALWSASWPLSVVAPGTVKRRAS